MIRLWSVRASRSPVPLALLLALLVVACTPDHYPQTALRPLADFARIGDDVQTTTLYWAVGVFVLVEAALVYAIFRFRGRPGDAEPVQVHGNTVVEIIWTAIPALILAAIAVPTVKGIFKTNSFPKGNVLDVEVIGHQWWWEFRYPKYNLTTANELVIPVGQTVAIRQNSNDVVHSFWPPRFAGKRDVFPGRETRMWFKAEQAGEYPGQCTEFCGIQHARMAFRVVAHTPGDFSKWLDHMQKSGPKPAATSVAPSGGVAPSGEALNVASAGASPSVVQGAQAKSPDTLAGKRQGSEGTAAAKDSGSTVSAPVPPQNPMYAQGEKLFLTKGCIGCHSVNAYNAPKGMVGPNLGNVGGRSYIAAGVLKNTDENLARWIRNPQAIKEGVVMPNLGVTEPEAKALVAYLRAHQ